MVGSALAFDWLADVFETTSQRLIVTIVTVAVLLVILRYYPAAKQAAKRYLQPLHVDVVGAVMLVGVVALAAAIVLGVWEQTSILEDIWAESEFGSETAALAIVSGILLFIAYVVVRFVGRLIDDVLGTASSVSDHQRELTFRIAQVIIYSMAIITVLGIWIDDLGAIFVGAGFLGIVLGMAARQTLGAILAGFVLMFSRPFEIGDWIEIDDQYEGIVTNVSIINTRIRSVNGEYIIVPNDVVGSNAVTNRSRTGRLRIDVDVGVDYETDLERASQVATEAVSTLEMTVEKPEPNVVSKSFDESAVTLCVRFWIQRPNAQRRARARTAAIHAIREAFDDAAVKIPFPQRELSDRSETGGTADGTVTDTERTASTRSTSTESSNVESSTTGSDYDDTATAGSGASESSTSMTGGKDPRMTVSETDESNPSGGDDPGSTTDDDRTRTASTGSAEGATSTDDDPPEHDP